MTEDKILFFDVESGGLDDSKHSLLRIGLVIWKNGIILDKLEIFIKSDNYCYDEESMKINKIDLNWLTINGISEQQAIEEINSFVNKYFPNSKALLGGHNIYFDIAFLKRLYRENSISFSSYFEHRTIDTCSIMKYLYFCDKLPKQVQSLTSACKYFNFEIDDNERHGALYDAEITSEVFTKLLELNRKK